MGSESKWGRLRSLSALQGLGVLGSNLFSKLELENYFESKLHVWIPGDQEINNISPGHFMYSLGLCSQVYFSV